MSGEDEDALIADLGAEKLMEWSEAPGLRREAVFTPDRRHRLRLGREWAASAGAGRPPRDARTAVFIMLNPSTAGAHADDATIRRCTRFARSWRLTAIEVVNLFTLVATDPTELVRASRAGEPLNSFTPHADRYIARAAAASAEARWPGVLVAAWGNGPGGLRDLVRERGEQVRRIVEAQGGGRLHCLGTTSSGAPKHPLYLASDTRLVPWPGHRAAAARTEDV